jgi:MFS family permease
MNGVLIVLLSIQVSNAAGRWPRFPAMALAAFLLGAGYGLNGLARGLPVYVLAVAVWTLGEITASAVAPALIADLSPVDLRGLYQGIWGAAWGLSFFLGPLAGGWAYEHLGPAALWTGCLALGWLVAIGFLSMNVPARKRMLQLTR